MKILVTGANGFVGKNLCVSLSEHELYKYDIGTNPSLLDEYCKDTDFVFHLAGVNRPKEESEFMEGNFVFTSTLLENLQKHNNPCPIVLSSSTQAALDNPYGLSKRAGEDLLKNYASKTGTQVFIYRFPNLFGKWCRPNYNSAIATFCYNTARDLPITISDPNNELTLMYIDDVLNEFKNVMINKVQSDIITHKANLGYIVDLLKDFKKQTNTLLIPVMSDLFIKKLYSTYLSYLPEDKFSYPLKMNIDNRGSFTEIIRTEFHGQFSVNITVPGITKGNHWHHTKTEKFLVVSGEGIIKFRRIDSTDIIEYMVSGNVLEVVDIPPGYTHNIENTGDVDLVTFMWCNEKFDPNNPDTVFLEV
jgi:UDP-2-acetamido-2,6-beta-L-arabino-hexul-4-ose reductase